MGTGTVCGAERASPGAGGGVCVWNPQRPAPSCCCPTQPWQRQPRGGGICSWQFPPPRPRPPAPCLPSRSPVPPPRPCPGHTGPRCGGGSGRLPLHPPRLPGAVVLPPPLPAPGPAAPPPRGARGRAGPSPLPAARSPPDGAGLARRRHPRCPRGGAGLGCPGSAGLGSARPDPPTDPPTSARPAPATGPGRPWGARPGGGPAAGGSGEAPPAAPLARSPAGHARPQDAGLGDPARHASRLHHHRHVDRVSAAGRPLTPRRRARGRPGCGAGCCGAGGWRMLRDAAGQGVAGQRWAHVRLGHFCMLGRFHTAPSPHSHPAWSLRPGSGAGVWLPGLAPLTPRGIACPCPSVSAADA